MALWQFWFFLIVTIIRQIPHLYLEWERRGSEKKFSGGKLTTIMMYGFYLVIWLGCLVLSYSHIYKNTPLIIGSVILVVGILTRFTGLFALGRCYSGQITVYKNHSLVTHGIYRFVRHPLHLALIVELLGMIIFVEGWWFILAWLILIGIIAPRNKREDSILVQQFGKTAIEYQKKVPALNIIKGIISYYKEGKPVPVQ